MKSETRGLLAIVLSMAVFAAWYKWVAPPQTMDHRPLTMDQKTNTESAPANTTPAGTITFPPTHTGKSVPEQVVTIESDLYRVSLTNQGGVPTEWVLKKFNATNLVADAAKPAQFSVANANFFWTDQTPYQATQSKRDGREVVTFQWSGPEATVTKEFVFDPNSYVAEMNLSVVNRGRQPISGGPALSWEDFSKPKEARGFFSFLKGPPDLWYPLYFSETKVERQHKLGSEEGQEGKIYWAGMASRYFLTAFVPRETQDRKVAWGGQERPYVRLSFKPFHLPPKTEWKQTVALYVGPQEIGLLKGVGQRLEEAIDFGWFGIVAKPILYLLRIFYQVVHNYGVAIILLTVFIKLLLHPVNKKSMESMKAMQAVQPRLKEIREKYKDDKQRLQIEMMNLFKTNKINPMGGCLPMLLQLPVYIALYKVLWNSVELYQAPFFWFYQDLSAPDPYFISPVLLGIAMFLQQKMMPSVTADPAQQKMMMFMPLMFAGFMIFLPSGLTIYILVNTVMSIGQQWMAQKGLRLRDLLTGKFYSADGAR